MFPSLPALGELSQPFKRAQFGLFGGKTKLYGNNVPFSKHKTRRTWLPNVQRKRIPSDILGESVRLKVTTRVLRTIKKYGGLDNYLKGTASHKLGYVGLGLKLKVKDTEKQQQIVHSKTPEGQKELEKKLLAHSKWGLAIGTMKMGVKRTASILPGNSVEDARKARIDAGKALGLPGPANPAQTFKYLQAKA
ncbi:50S ribosomal protein L24 [Coprinopsis marcescibilis]|uniref:Large ribosomal subunit protein bL28c n=1 Tax=Coprinopsis marcescibilis TaxID=230819 RepID=A0A5C3L6Y4_COPMA|nr:50S ribosomal protein L24 [Coprinopsis marcescibilis]